MLVSALRRYGPERSASSPTPRPACIKGLLIDVWSRTGKQIFFITHSIEEALFLETRLIVMSPRPGRVVAEHELDFVSQFARNRDARAIKTAPEFATLREEIRAVVHQYEPSRSLAS